MRANLLKSSTSTSFLIRWNKIKPSSEQEKYQFFTFFLAVESVHLIFTTHSSSKIIGQALRFTKNSQVFMSIFYVFLYIWDDLRVPSMLLKLYHFTAVLPTILQGRKMSENTVEIPILVIWSMIGKENLILYAFEAPQKKK